MVERAVDVLPDGADAGRGGTTRITVEPIVLNLVLVFTVTVEVDSVTTDVAKNVVLDLIAGMAGIRRDCIPRRITEVESFDLLLIPVHEESSDQRLRAWITGSAAVVARKLGGIYVGLLALKFQTGLAHKVD